MPAPALTLDSANSIELTNLSPVITGREVDELVAVALDRELRGICVPPFWVKRAAREIGDRPLSLTTVVGFPFGFQMTETKILETELALRDGANEVDFVWHHSSFASGMPWTKIELAKASHLVHSQWKLLKVVLDVNRWSDGQLKEAIKLCADTGVDFIVTSNDTSQHIRAEDIKILRSQVPSGLGLKVCCAIRDAHEAESLVSAGADRIGTEDRFWTNPTKDRR